MFKLNLFLCNFKRIIAMSNMDHIKYTDEQLLEGLTNGDQSIFKYIYTAYYNELCAYICNYTDRQSAEDIVQGILLKLWEGRQETTIHTSIKSYLYKSVYYKFLDTARKNKRINEKLETIRHNALHEIIEDDHDLSEQRLVILRKAIAELPPKCKEIFLMSKYEGLKYKEIAQTLGISISTVEGQIGKAFKVIKTKLSSSKFINLFISFFRNEKLV